MTACNCGGSPLVKTETRRRLFRDEVLWVTITCSRNCGRFSRAKTAEEAELFWNHPGLFFNRAYWLGVNMGLNAGNPLGRALTVKLFR